MTSLGLLLLYTDRWRLEGRVQGVAWSTVHLEIALSKLPLAQKVVKAKDDGVSYALGIRFSFYFECRSELGRWN